MNILNQKNLNISLLLLLLACTANSFGMEQAVSRLATSVRAAGTRLAARAEKIWYGPTPRSRGEKLDSSINRIQFCTMIIGGAAAYKVYEMFEIMEDIDKKLKYINKNTGYMIEVMQTLNKHNDARNKYNDAR